MRRFMLDVVVSCALDSIFARDIVMTVTSVPVESLTYSSPITVLVEGEQDPTREFLS